MRTKLYVDNLPASITEESLGAFFAPVVKVEKIEIVLNTRSGQPEGHGFVEVASEEEARKAIHDLNGKPLDGKHVTVTHAGPVARHGGFSGSATTEERKNR